MIIGVDVDEVCADLLTEWVRRYNAYFNDTLRVQDITEWDMTKVVKSHVGTRIYDILHEPGLYSRVRPIDGAKLGVDLIRGMGHRVIFVSACVPGTVDAKLAWLIEWGFLTKAQAGKDFICAYDKHLIGVDMLIDDRLENVESFPGPAILVTMPHNAGKFTTRPRVASLLDSPRTIRLLLGRDAYQPEVSRI